MEVAGVQLYEPELAMLAGGGQRSTLTVWAIPNENWMSETTNKQ